LKHRCAAVGGGPGTNFGSGLLNEPREKQTISKLVLKISRIAQRFFEMHWT